MQTRCHFLPFSTYMRLFSHPFSPFAVRVGPVPAGEAPKRTSRRVKKRHRPTRAPSAFHRAPGKRHPTYDRLALSAAHNDRADAVAIASQCVYPCCLEAARRGHTAVLSSLYAEGLWDAPHEDVLGLAASSGHYDLVTSCARTLTLETCAWDSLQLRLARHGDGGAFCYGYLSGWFLRPTADVLRVVCSLDSVPMYAALHARTVSLDESVATACQNGAVRIVEHLVEGRGVALAPQMIHNAILFDRDALLLWLLRRECPFEQRAATLQAVEEGAARCLRRLWRHGAAVLDVGVSRHAAETALPGIYDVLVNELGCPLDVGAPPLLARWRAVEKDNLWSTPEDAALCRTRVRLLDTMSSRVRLDRVRQRREEGPRRPEADASLRSVRPRVATRRRSTSDTH